MNKIKSFKVFNESLVYDEDFNEYLVKNMFSEDHFKSELWSIISDLVQYIKQFDQEILIDFRNDLLHDNKNNALKIALKYAMKISSDKIQPIIDKLLKLKNETNDIKNVIKLNVKNIIQAEDLKHILESKPWYSKVKIEGHNLLVDIKNNTIEQIKNLLEHLPFQVTML